MWGDSGCAFGMVCFCLGFGVLLVVFVCAGVFCLCFGVFGGVVGFVRVVGVVVLLWGFCVGGLWGLGLLCVLFCCVCFFVLCGFVLWVWVWCFGVCFFWCFLLCGLG